MITAGYHWLLVATGDPVHPIRLSSEEGSLLALTADPDLETRVAETYFGFDANAAALDMTRHLAESVGSVAGGVATVAIDATEPWGRYEDGGVAFLRSLFRQLAGSTEFSTALPSELSVAVGFRPRLLSDRARQLPE